MLFAVTSKELKILLPVILIGICGTLEVDIHFLSLLDSLSINYIIGVKPKDHQLLFDWVKAKGLKKHEFIDNQGVEHNFEYYNQAPLNHASFDYKVNFLSDTQTKPKGKKVKFSWVTSLEITEDNLYKIMRAGRT